MPNRKAQSASNPIPGARGVREWQGREERGEDRPRHAQGRPRAADAGRQHPGQRHGGDRAGAGGEQNEREGRVGQAEQRLDQRDGDGPGADRESGGEEDRGHADPRPDQGRLVLVDRRSARHRRRGPIVVGGAPGAVASREWDRVHRVEWVSAGRGPSLNVIPASAATRSLEAALNPQPPRRRQARRLLRPPGPGRPHVQRDLRRPAGKAPQPPEYPAPCHACARAMAYCEGPASAPALRARIWPLHSTPQARIDRPVDKRRASHPLPLPRFTSQRCEQGALPCRRVGRCTSALAARQEGGQCSRACAR